VQEEDLKRVAAATGASVQTTVNNLDTKVLGTCEQFEEVQVRMRTSFLLSCFLSTLHGLSEPPMHCR
jgi:hypothetical protein